MKFSLALLLITLFLNACGHHKAHWGYKGGEGPGHWAELTEDYKSCGLGTHQSPVNLSVKKATSKKQNVKFYYHPTPAIIQNNGHTIQFDMKEENYIYVDGKKFKLMQLHFHSPSEHTINGKHYPAEMHLVHQAKDKSLAVVGILIEKGKKSRFDHIFDKIPHQGKTEEVQDFHLEALVSQHNAHYFYSGSLTTPPCSENVSWMVLDKHLVLTKKQLKKFTNFYDHNNRPVQKKGKHHIFHSRN